ncbi:13505_t:CDS:10 [Ambispora gerdemannii]|uniref:13505_t:CDS:1 n=1 Tax=Ambispora gerdemannii TaxID=144530 RepID=A0A9N9EZE0_9GLOM|nr:13505_t:CDS:10 [Ambispora gerdemannii]
MAMQSESVQGLQQQRGHINELEEKRWLSEPENDRDLISHYVFKKILGGNYVCPINANNMEKCLEVGYGCGIWMMEMASAFPECQFYGIDLDPDTPDSTYPNNCNFLKGDFTDGLPYPDETFDLVHVKSLLVFKPMDHILQLIKEIYRVTKKGGYFEYKESLDVINPGPTLSSIQERRHSILNEQNIDNNLVRSFDRTLRQQGWADATLTIYLVPLGDSDKTIPRLCFEKLRLYYEKFADIFTEKLKLPNKEEFKKSLQNSNLEPECEKFKSDLEIAAGFASKYSPGISLPNLNPKGGGGLGPIGAGNAHPQKGEFDPYFPWERGQVPCLDVVTPTPETVVSPNDRVVIRWQKSANCTAMTPLINFDVSLVASPSVKGTAAKPKMSSEYQTEIATGVQEMYYEWIVPVIGYGSVKNNTAYYIHVQCVSMVNTKDGEVVVFGNSLEPFTITRTATQEPKTYYPLDKPTKSLSAPSNTSMLPKETNKNNSTSSSDGKHLSVTITEMPFTKNIIALVTLFLGFFLFM